MILIVARKHDYCFKACPRVSSPRAEWIFLYLPLDNQSALGTGIHLAVVPHREISRLCRWRVAKTGRSWSSPRVPITTKMALVFYQSENRGKNDFDSHAISCWQYFFYYFYRWNGQYFLSMGIWALKGEELGSFYYWESKVIKTRKQ